jgi:hypothetical protein
MPRNANTPTEIARIVAGLEGLGWEANTPYYARLEGVSFGYWDYQGFQEPKLPTSGAPQLCFDGHMALGYFPGSQTPSDTLAAQVWGSKGYTWSWVPYGAESERGATLKAVVEAAVGTWGAVEVRKVHDAWYEFTVTANAPGPEQNDHWGVGQGVRLYCPTYYTYGGGWGMRSAENPTQDAAAGGGRFELGLWMNQWRNLVIDFASLYGGERQVASQNYIGIGDVYPRRWWQGPYQPPCLNAYGANLTDPVRVIANPYQFHMADGGMREYGYSGIDGGTSFLASSPCVPEHLRETVRYAAVAVANCVKGYLYWRGPDVSGTRTVCLDGARFVHTPAYPWQADSMGLRVPFAGKSMPLLGPNGAPVEWDAWVAAPRAAGQESRIVGKLWDGFVLSQHVPIGSEAVMSDGGIYRVVGTSQTDWQGAPQASLWLCVERPEEE